MTTAAITFRTPKPEDSAKIFSWRNLREMVIRASEQKPIAWEEHTEWFARVTSGNDHLLLMIVHDGEDIGVARFDRENRGEAVISIYLLPEFTARGLGVVAIRLSCIKSFETWDIARIYARIRKENRPAIVAFGRAGFVEVLDEKHLLGGHVVRVCGRGDVRDLAG